MSKKILLENENLTVSDVAYSCGFTTSQYFSTVFKKHEKCSTNEYRKLNTIDKSLTAYPEI